MTVTPLSPSDTLAYRARVPAPPRPVIGMGAFLKVSVAVMAEGWAALSPSLGDLDTPEARAGFDALVARMLDHLGTAPRVVAHDLHPDFPTTQAAQILAERTGALALPVQHHHAHIAAVAAENGHLGPVLGLALDGFGLGTDDGAWGGELLWVDGAAMVRLGHLMPLPQPGGDIAAREPWRMAAAALHALGRTAEIPDRFPDQPPAALLPQVLDKPALAPPTSSAGRVFDAACGLLGVHPVADFEGQAPMALEWLVSTPRVMEGGWRLVPGAGAGAPSLLDLRPVLAALAGGGLSPAEGADLFHGTFAAALVDWATAAARQTGVTVVGLSGGCFLNRVLTDAVVTGLRARGLRVLTHRAVSPGDAGLALGQAWVAAHHAAVIP